MLHLLLHGSTFDTVLGPAVGVTVNGATFRSFCGPLEARRAELLGSNNNYNNNYNTNDNNNNNNNGTDQALLALVYRCLAEDPADRPRLVALAAAVHERVLNRGDGGVERETDEAIFRLVRELLHDP